MMDQRTNYEVKRTKADTKKLRETCTDILISLDIAFCAVGVVVIVVMLIVLLFIPENFPRISITSLQVSSSAANDDNNGTLPQSAAAADIVFSMVLNNRADYIEYSSGIKASLYYQGNLLASTSLYPFQQKGKNDVTEKKVRMRSMSMKQIVGNTNQGVISFDIYLVSSSTNIPRDDYAKMNVLCNGIRVKFTNVTTSAGYMVDAPVYCSVDVQDAPPQFNV